MIAGHITRDLFAKCIGWREFEFVFNDLNARDEETELAVQVQLLQAGVLTVDEVRAMRGLAPLAPSRRHKHLHLLKWVNERTWALGPRRLKTVRPFFWIGQERNAI